MRKTTAERPRRPKDVYSLRLDAELLDRIDSLADLYHSAHFAAGFGAGEPPIPKRSEIVRWALREGLAALEGKLQDALKKRTR